MFLVSRIECAGAGGDPAARCGQALGSGWASVFVARVSVTGFVGAITFVHELIKLSFVLGFAQALKEGFEVVLLFLQAAQRFSLIGVKCAVAGWATHRVATAHGFAGRIEHTFAMNISTRPYFYRQLLLTRIIRLQFIKIRHLFKV